MMDFNLTPEQRAIQALAEDFAETQLAPHAARWDSEAFFPVSVLRALAKLGFAGIYVREDVGGSALSRLDATLIFEALARGCTSTAAFLSIHNMASWMVDCFGSTAQRKSWLPRLTSMDWIASYCLTESGAGSDAAGIRSRAVRDGDDYIINGSKAFISGAGVSDVYLVMLRTSDDGAQGISCFLIERDIDGVSFGANEHKMGWNSQPTAQIMFDDVRVPSTHRIGASGSGFRFAMQGLDGGRLNIAAASLGTAQKALDMSLAYARERTQFGKVLAEFQAIQFKLADMATELAAARLLLREAASKQDCGAAEATQYAAMAKRFVTDIGFRVVNEALQIHGGYGYLRDFGIERMVRDLRVHQILEGTNEIMRVIIAREMLK